MQENISINKKLRSGIDLIEIKRLEKSYEKFGMRMLTRLYDESEIDIFSKRKGYNGARYLAKNFAGKEAVSKVLGYGFTNGVRPRDIIIHNNEYNVELGQIVPTKTSIELFLDNKEASKLVYNKKEWR